MKKYILLALLFVAFAFQGNAQSPKMTEDWSKAPKLVVPGKRNKAPSDAIVLFNKSKDLSKWQKRNGEQAEWKTRWWWCGAMEVNHTGGILSKQSFGDCQYHVEFKTPRRFDPEQEGQGRGNSGFYIMGNYEVQILDSWDNETYYNGQAGSIYKQSAPLVNASKKPGKWQAYDIIFHGPRFSKDGKLLKAGTITVFHNGVLIQDHYELKGPTRYAGYPKYEAHEEKMPLLLQDHGNPIRFRNIWVREL